MSIPIIPTVIDWYCPECGQTDQTNQPGMHVRYHTCPRLRYLSTPMLRKGVAGRVHVREREDYVGNEQVQTDGDGRPVMSIVTEYENGRTDAIVFAPVATARMEV